MHDPLIISIRSTFETHTIACAGYDVVIPQEANGIFALLHTGMCVLVHLRVFAVLLLLIQSQRFPGLGKSASEEEDVARLELNVALLGNRFNLVKSNCVTIHAVMIKAILLGVGNVVDQKPSGCDSFLGPVPDADSVTVPILDFVASSPTVPQPFTWRHFTAIVAKAVPLRACLRIEAPDVVPRYAFVIGNPNDLMVKRETIKAYLKPMLTFPL